VIKIGKRSRRAAASSSAARDSKNNTKEHIFQLKMAIIGGIFLIIAAVIGAWATGVFTLQSQPGASSTVPPTGPLVSGDASTFVRDVTYPDYSKVYVGTHFTKTWELQDSGSAMWTGRYLAALGPSSGGCKYPARVPVPTTSPGETVDISVSVTASASPGTCDVTWKMVTRAGQLYFPNDTEGIWFKVTVATSKE
jgi:hypothetical protein